MLPFSVESRAATCRVRYSYPDPVDNFCSVIVTPLKAARRRRVARCWRMKEVCGGRGLKEWP